ncbi:MAG: O-acetylhomoserine aminocarboxypropyltransferase [Microbacterium sp. SCN 70-200]|uniref:O-acetylhomoserine aminocarboxypropyltransferase/cysteine synthase family protein n=1 Tax=unclassified Microbacterium TaxID=2609290 RepID=UPI00086CCA2B|nr:MULTISPECIES: aminotransferase class I/II-fold pyridoxal phosphate-dependent enzyme [unclassified Microbacterium]MBN9213652.1 O-acetylhomoserine aminocarboxypropyltransferase/cysteine synthase [Microbacterium sp.]ODT42203.1 MAG: O-acetylhomoserine aminocarboxypropyltransferase [Microbacterium sp. SCN 70-200]OJV79168.1 MAG: O-acetylhomoserine aminocarboxypropyltransferase [Microbacterium sp. 70-16]
MGRRGFTTRQLHEREAVPAPTARATPIYLTAGFEFDEYDAAASHFGEGHGYAYTRTGNPTIEAVEHRLASLEGGSQALLLSSGQAATSVALLGLLESGQHIVSSTHIYEGTRGLLRDNLVRLGITTTFVDDIDDLDAWEAAIRPNTRALFVESISNATNRLVDIAALAGLAHSHGIPLVVDSTFATPYLVRPIEHGADVVVHSTSKFLSGHGSVIGGAIVDAGTFDAERSGALFPQLVAPGRTGAPSFAERWGGDARIAYLRESVAPRFGTTPSPLNAFLLGQGMETLSLRVQRQSENALAVAQWLESCPQIETVDYVGLPSHPDHALAQRYLPDGYGAVFSFTVRGGAAAARAFVERLEVFTHMTHLGDVRSLVLHPASTSHVFLTEAEQRAVGVEPDTLRFSIGIEDAADLIDDLAAALAFADDAAVAAV